MRTDRTLFIAIVLLGLASGVYAHPHIWIDTYVDVNLGADGLETIDVRWVFDEFFSSAVMLDLDTNGNRRIDETERQTLYHNMFQGMADVDFFLLIDVGGQRVRPANPRAFSASIVAGRLEYRFRLDVAVGWDDLDGLRIAAFDRSYYTHFATRVGGRDSYTHGGNVVRVGQGSRRMETEGWGWVQLQALELALN